MRIPFAAGINGFFAGDKHPILGGLLRMNTTKEYNDTELNKEALKKKWDDWGVKIDLRPYNAIVDKVKSEFEVFKAGKTKYY